MYSLGDDGYMGKGKNEHFCSAEQLLYAMFKNKHKGFMIVSRQGMIIQINNTLAEILGKRNDEIVGRHLIEVCHHHGLCKIIQILKNGEPEYGRIDNIDGKSVLVDYLPIYNQGKVCGALVEVSFFYDESGNRYREEDVSKYEDHMQPEKIIDHIMGRSQQIINLKKTIVKIAPRNSNVLITGECGTGKEIFARAIHSLSFRRRGPFIKINCAVIPGFPIESKFWGSEEVFFAGVKKGDRVGDWETAMGGTLLLDGISDLSLPLQARVLRLIQQNEMGDSGGKKTVYSDVRVIATSNVELDYLVKYKKFREDLYYRLNVINIYIPPLRERREDILELAYFFIKKYNQLFGFKVKGLSPKVEALFVKYSWPGNVRELENVIERAFNVIEGDIINVSHLPYNMVQRGSFGDHNAGNGCGRENINLVSALSKGQTLAEIMENTEKKLILQALEVSNGNKARASKILGISRPGLYKKLMKYGMM